MASALLLLNKAVEEGLAKQIAMQIAAMNPIAVDEDGVSEEIKQKEIDVAIREDKKRTGTEAVEAALKKAGINPAHVDSETTWKATWPKAGLLLKTWQRQRNHCYCFCRKAAHLPEQMIQNIAIGPSWQVLERSLLAEPGRHHGRQEDS